MSTRLSCYDFILFPGTLYLMSDLSDYSREVTCKAPVVAWQYAFYSLMLIMRINLLLYCLSTNLAKYCVRFGMGILFPACIIIAIGLTHGIQSVLSEPHCYPKETTRPWTVFLCLIIAVFLIYIHALLSCGWCYKNFK